MTGNMSTRDMKNQRIKHSTRSTYNMQTHRDLSYNKSRVASYSTSKNTNSIINNQSFRKDDDERVQNVNLWETKKPLVGSLQRKLSIKPSASFEVDKPSIVPRLTFDSVKTHGGGGYQSYSSNLVRQNNVKKEAKEYKEKRKLDASIRRWKRKVDEAAGGSDKKEPTTEEREERS